MKIGFIGCGNMAIAMLKGILKSGEVKNADMIASAKSDKTGHSEGRHKCTGCGFCRRCFSGSETAVSGRSAG